MKTYALAGNIIGRKPQNGGNGGGYREEVAYTMDTIGNFGIAQVEDDMEQQVYDARGNGDGKTANTITGDHANRVTDFTPICVHGSQDPISNTEHANAVNRNNGLENCVCQYGKSAGTLTERHDSSPCADRGQNVVAIPINSMCIGKDIKEGDRQTTGIGKEGDPCPTLQTEHHHAVASHLSVRRLLPIECERLMGMPDNWTRIPWRGKPPEECPDAPRYKACGNSMGVNCMRWIGLGIQSVENKTKGDDE